MLWSPILAYAGIEFPPLLPVACVEGKPLYYLGGKVSCGTGVPTIAACGLGVPTVVGTDYDGVVTTGTGILTSCSVVFSKTMSVVPKCMVSNTLGAIWITAIGTTGFTVTGVTITNSNIFYICWGSS